MRVWVLAATMSLGLAAFSAAAPASASTAWFWSEDRAETALIRYELDVYDAVCDGEGKRIRRRGVPLYRRFSCETDIGWGSLYVEGRHLFSYEMVWWGE